MDKGPGSGKGNDPRLMLSALSEPHRDGIARGLLDLVTMDTFADTQDDRVVLRHRVSTLRRGLRCISKHLGDADEPPCLLLPVELRYLTPF